ncbi:MAG TPA: hypothetical protein VL354_00725 [Spirochaetia bacterium]|nr:hypothetical protein [Spirochaetia bacterium]
MKSSKLFVTIALLAFGLSPVAWAQQPSDAVETPSGAGLSLGGAASTDDRVSTQSNPQLTFQEYRLELDADARPSEATKFHTEAWIRSAGLAPSSLPSTTSLFSVGSVAPVSLDLREAYFELNGFIFSIVDLKIGRQRIAWGTADKLNPTDNVNALDLSDPWDFGRHLGSDGVQLTVYAGDIQITGLAVAQFTPAVLPSGQWANALMPAAIQAPAGMSLANVTTNVQLPGLDVADSVTAGLKVKGNLLGYDLSVSYLYGRQSLPIVDSVVVTPVSMTSINAAAQLVYPREHVFGADLAGSIVGIGVWAEAAVFIPEKITLTTDLSAVGQGVVQSTALDSTPYVKYVLGGDYTFPGNVYLNGQFVHGLFQEAGNANLNDYFSVNLDWRLFDEKLKLTPLAFVFEVKNWSDIPHNYAILAAPSVTIHPMDNAELVVGFHWIQATNSTVYGALSGQNEVFAHARYSF